LIQARNDGQLTQAHNDVQLTQAHDDVQLTHTRHAGLDPASTSSHRSGLRVEPAMTGS
jgi:hypothetical protein